MALAVAAATIMPLTAVESRGARGGAGQQQ
jgi:hypothetical protein